MASYDIWKVSDDCDVCSLHQIGDTGVQCWPSDESEESEMEKLTAHNRVLKSHIAFLLRQLMDAKTRYCE